MTGLAFTRFWRNCLIDATRMTERTNKNRCCIKPTHFNGVFGCHSGSNDLIDPFAGQTTRVCNDTVGHLNHIVRQLRRSIEPLGDYLTYRQGLLGVVDGRYRVK